MNLETTQERPKTQEDIKNELSQMKDILNEFKEKQKSEEAEFGQASVDVLDYVEELENMIASKEETIKVGEVLEKISYDTKLAENREKKKIAEAPENIKKMEDQLVVEEKNLEVLKEKLSTSEIKLDSLILEQKIKASEEKAEKIKEEIDGLNELINKSENMDKQIAA